MNDDWGDEIQSWNGQRTSTPDKLAGCTVWVLGFIALMVLSVFLGQAVEAALQWWSGPT